MNSHRNGQSGIDMKSGSARFVVAGENLNPDSVPWQKSSLVPPGRLHLQGIDKYLMIIWLARIKIQVDRMIEVKV